MLAVSERRLAPLAWPQQTVLDRLLEAGGAGWTVIYHLASDQKTVLKLFLRYGARTWRVRGAKLPVFRPPSALAQEQSMTAEPGVTIWRQAATRTPPDLTTPHDQARYLAVRKALEVLKEISPCSTPSSTSCKPSPGGSSSSGAGSSSQAWPSTGPSEVIGDP